MIGKFLIFSLLWSLLGNPLLALIVLLIVIYILDHSFVGVLPSVSKPWKRRRSAARLRQQIALNTNDVTAKFDLARIWIEGKKYHQALEVLLEIQSRYEDSADYWNARGTAEVHTGHLEDGEQHLLKALDINPRVQYGEPYLHLAAAFKERDANKALHYLQQFQDIQSSSSEGYYLAGLMYRTLGRKDEAMAAFNQSIAVYRSLPKYRKRSERKWAVRSFFRKRIS
ncbi:tetratricopeptide repeat protein [Paenibacillus farraposensis]|uniref:Tetratricopeptide repeat protein n=1 Tax=Paenibacillus farraposensis TaxID=2807095 RepID=A0ABW4D643_9BACL|nr:tetratricopeptide repeat protein [Paenibacillus farraposensis]MCC3381406.1 tetratricopeptide repeat protein [Paenibacillus farraposensis]